MREVTEAQRRAIAELSAAKPDLWCHKGSIRPQTVDALLRRGLVACTEHRITQTRFYRLTPAGRAALADAGGRDG
jgi:hypothetical protein